MKKLFLLAVLVPMMMSAQERIMVIADPHVMAASLHDNGKAFTDMMAKQRKMLDLSEAAWKEMMALVQTSQPDLLLIPGDLTKDGEIVSHNIVVNDLILLNELGIKTLLIPGNHDIGGTSYQYFGEETTPVATLKDNEWWSYYESVSSGLVAKDANSHSFAAEPFEGITVLGIDGAHNSAGTGYLSEQTLAWILNQADAANEKGHMIIAMCHWQLMDHFDKQGSLESACQLKDAANIRDSLMQHGVHVVLTGHFHVNGITTYRNGSDSIMEITTGSPITFPCPYRLLTASKDRKTLQVETAYLSSLPEIDDLYTYSRSWMAVHAHDMIYQMAPRVWSRVDEMKSKIAAQLGEAMTEQLMDCIPDTEEERITLVDKHLGSTVVDLYLLHSEANEPDHKEADSLAQALYTGMNNMIDEVLDAKPVIKYAIGGTIKSLANSMAQEPLQSLVEDKTQWASESPDRTDDLMLYATIANGYDPIQHRCENVNSRPSDAHKVLRHGQLYLIYKGHVYNVQGQKIQ